MAHLPPPAELIAALVPVLLLEAQPRQYIGNTLVCVVSPSRLKLVHGSLQLVCSALGACRSRWTVRHWQRQPGSAQVLPSCLKTGLEQLATHLQHQQEQPKQSNLSTSKARHRRPVSQLPQIGSSQLAIQIGACQLKAGLQRPWRLQKEAAKSKACPLDRRTKFLAFKQYVCGRNN